MAAKPMDTTRPSKGAIRSANGKATKSQEYLRQNPKPLHGNLLNGGQPFIETVRLREEFGRTRLDFIWTDLGLCLALATIVKT